jgi:hypothetical protein
MRTPRRDTYTLAESRRVLGTNTPREAHSFKWMLMLMLKRLCCSFSSHVMAVDCCVVACMRAVMRVG